MKTARNLLPKKLAHKTGYSDGMREHHSEFKHPGVTKHEGGMHQWAHGKDDDEHMSHPGVPFTDENPDSHATSHSGIHKGRSGMMHPRLAHIHSMLRRG